MSNGLLVGCYGEDILKQELDTLGLILVARHFQDFARWLYSLKRGQPTPTQQWIDWLAELGKYSESIR